MSEKEPPGKREWSFPKEHTTPEAKNRMSNPFGPNGASNAPHTPNNRLERLNNIRRARYEAYLQRRYGKLPGPSSQLYVKKAKSPAPAPDSSQEQDDIDHVKMYVDGKYQPRLTRRDVPTSPPQMNRKTPGETAREAGQTAMTVLMSMAAGVVIAYGLSRIGANARTTRRRRPWGAFAGRPITFFTGDPEQFRQSDRASSRWAQAEQEYHSYDQFRREAEYGAWMGGVRPGAGVDSASAYAEYLRKRSEDNKAYARYTRATDSFRRYDHPLGATPRTGTTGADTAYSSWDAQRGARPSGAAHWTPHSVGAPRQHLNPLLVRKERAARLALGLSAHGPYAGWPKVSKEELRTAFNARVKATHPDVSGGDAEAFQNVKESYEYLRKKIAS